MARDVLPWSRLPNLHSKITRGICSDSLMNYDTIKYFVGEKHESERYREALLRFQAVQLRFRVGMDLLQFGQGFFMVSTTLTMAVTYI